MAWYRLIKVFFLIAFFVSTLVLSFGVPQVFNSPDENANWQFATNFAKTWEIPLAGFDNLDLAGLIHPRSVLVIGDRLVPISFLGLPVVSGLVGRIFGESTILLFTPLLAVLALVAWRSIIWRLFEDSILADLAAFFLAVHPAFWYYSGRVMMHNVAFVSLLIFSLWFLIYQPWPRRAKFDWNFVGAGLMLGLSIATRASELTWIFVLALAVWIIYRSSVSYRQLGYLIIGTLAALVPFALFNQELYGNFLTTGYTAPDLSGQALSAVASVTSSNQFAIIGARIWQLIFPFGFHELATLRHVWSYGFVLYPWLSFLAVVGLVIAFFSDRLQAVTTPHLSVNSRLWRQLAVITILLSGYLGLLYGSWNINDNPDPTAVTIANSYARYWLPLFVLSSAFSALAVRFAVRRFGHHGWYNLCVGATLLVVFISSAQIVWGGEDGFISTRSHLREFDYKRSLIIDATESDSIIIVDRADKYLWPERQVIVPLRSEKTYRHLSELVAAAPLYYFGITLPESDLNFLESTVLMPNNLKMTKVLTVGEESLYLIYD